MNSGSMPREGNPRRLVYRVRATDGTYRSRDGGYSNQGAVWVRLSHLKGHRRQARSWNPFRKGDRVVEFEMVELRAFPVEELDK